MKNTLKTVILLLLEISILVLANVQGVGAASSTNTFKDVKNTAWYNTYVNKLVYLKITAGYKDGTYKPANTVTRAEFVTFLCKTKGYFQTKGDPFTDTQKHWASGYITIALANGIMDLPISKKFRPDDAITRLEAVEMMCRALNISTDTTSKNPYADVKTITGYTNAAYTNYLMQGSVEKNKRYFKPSDKLTRGEVASVIVNAYEYNADRMGFLNNKMTIKIEPSNTKQSSASTPAQSSINLLVEKGILQSGEINVSANINLDKYITLLVRTLGKTNESDYIKAATDLGIIKDGEFKNYNRPITRAEMAKVSLRTHERLNRVTYPDYLEAYKTMVTDYKTIKDAEIKQQSVKCVSEGLMDMVNGEFKPASNCTGKLAVITINRILSAELRDKAKPVFATPDKEFEAFMSDWSKSMEVCSRGHIDRVIDGKVLWKTWKDGVCLLPTSTNKDSNKEGYNSLKALVNCARKYNHWVEAYYSCGSDPNMLQLMYTSNQQSGQNGGARQQHNFGLGICFNNTYTLYSDPDEKGVQKKSTDYIWGLGKLFDGSKAITGRTLEQYQEKELIEPFKALFNAIYEPKLASYLADYMINDDMKKIRFYESPNHKGNYMFESLLYPKQFSGLEIQIKRDPKLNLGTNKIN